MLIPHKEVTMDTRTNEDWIAAFAAYLQGRFPGRSTAKHYVSDMQLFVDQHPQPLATITRHDIDTFVDAQHARGLAPATVKRRAAALKTFFDFLADELREPQRLNPVQMRRHAARQPHLLPRDLTDPEVSSFLALVIDLRDRAMVCLMLYAGLRVGEVATLHPADLTVSADAQAPVRLRVRGKGQKERIVYLCAHGYQPLADYLQAHPPASLSVPLFRTRLGSGVTVAGIQERVQQYAQRCGVDVTCHRLRHTYARWLAEGETPVLALSRLLGHASIQTTQRYIDGADPQIRRSYEAAMERQPLRLSAPQPTADLLPAALRSEPATVTRPAPRALETSSWLEEAPDDVRQGGVAWLQHQWPLWKPSQRRAHASKRLRALRAFWQWQVARRTFSGWADLTSADLAAFMDAELARGIHPTTVKTTLDRVYEVLRFLADRGAVSVVPVRPALSQPDPLPRHLTPAEVLALETTLEQATDLALPNAQLNRALYYLLSQAGLRISEALDLQMQDMDLVARRVRVRDGKGRRDRVVYLSSKASGALAAYLQTVPHASADVVLSRQGQPLSYSEAWARMRDLGRVAGVGGVSPHRLRHTYATQLLNNGMTIDALRRLMGHENLNTTLIYARLADSTLEHQYQTAMERVTANSVNLM